MRLKLVAFLLLSLFSISSMAGSLTGKIGEIYVDGSDVVRINLYLNGGADSCGPADYNKKSFIFYPENFNGRESMIYSSILSAKAMDEDVSLSYDCYTSVGGPNGEYNVPNGDHILTAIELK